MKERSKNAARNRRLKENLEFAELAKSLYLPSNSTARLDKASIIRLTTATLKLRQIFPEGLGANWGSVHTAKSQEIRELSTEILQTLDGFAVVLAPDGKICFISANASVTLGSGQLEMTGNSIYEYLHEEDHQEMASLLNTVPSDIPMGVVRTPVKFSMRMRCIVSKRNAGLTYDGYKVIHLTGYLKFGSIFNGASDGGSSSSVERSVVGLLAYGQSFPQSCPIGNFSHVNMPSSSFMLKTKLCFEILCVDARISDFTGYKPNYLVNTTLYKFVHNCDTEQLEKDHRTLKSKDQVITSYYRFLTKGGGWIWIQSHCSVIYNSRCAKPYSMSMLNHVLSNVEYPSTVLDLIQIPKSDNNLNEATQRPSWFPQRDSKRFRKDDDETFVATGPSADFTATSTQSALSTWPAYESINENLSGDLFHFPAEVPRSQVLTGTHSTRSSNVAVKEPIPPTSETFHIITFAKQNTWYPHSNFLVPQAMCSFQNTISNDGDSNNVLDVRLSNSDSMETGQCESLVLGTESLNLDLRFWESLNDSAAQEAPFNTERDSSHSSLSSCPATPNKLLPGDVYNNSITVNSNDPYVTNLQENPSDFLFRNPNTSSPCTLNPIASCETAEKGLHWLHHPQINQSCNISMDSNETSTSNSQENATENDIFAGEWFFK